MDRHASAGVRSQVLGKRLVWGDYCYSEQHSQERFELFMILALSWSAT